MQAPSLDPVLDRFRAESQVQQLEPGDDAVLLVGQRPSLCL